MPKYPDIALRAGLEGNVFVKAWVDKEGKVRKGRSLESRCGNFCTGCYRCGKSDGLYACNHARKPVSVWVSIPFHFRLKNAK